VNSEMLPANARDCHRRRALKRIGLWNGFGLCLAGDRQPHEGSQVWAASNPASRARRSTLFAF